MVCQGTRKYVLLELKKLGLKLKSFETGEIEFHRELSQKETEDLVLSLRKYGLEVLSLKRRHMKNTSVAFHSPEPVNPLVEYIIEEKEVEMKEEPILTAVNG